MRVPAVGGSRSSPPPSPPDRNRGQRGHEGHPVGMSASSG